MRNWWSRPDGSVATSARGAQLLHIPALNKGTAFSAAERAALELDGLLPPRVVTLDEQAKRAFEQYSLQSSDLRKHVYMSSLHDRNETLFYRVLCDHLVEMLPIVYTPTIGEAIKQYSREFRRPGGLYLSIDDIDGIKTAFDNLALGPDDVDILVATDGEGILGIGDWGVGGMDIAVGKLEVYAAAGGMNPNRSVAVMLDSGTDNDALLDDEFYVGNRHARISDERYDAFIDSYVAIAHERFPHALLHWEDFGAGNARRVLNRWRDRVCSFNDDMQGTAAIVLAAVLAAVRMSGVPLREQRMVIFGAGTAGAGIADQIADAMVRDGLPAAEAPGRFWCFGRHGLIVTGMAGVRDFQVPYARDGDEVSDYVRNERDEIDLLEVVRRVHPTMLIGTSTIPGAFSEAVVREMARHVERPAILPLSNPTTLAEAQPRDLLQWTQGRALIVTGSPFAEVIHDGVAHTIGQANNALLFPGLGLGAVVARARLITDSMLRAAAEAVAGLVRNDSPGASLLPDVADLRAVTAVVARAVVAAAQADGVAGRAIDSLDAAVADAMWRPVYRPIVAAPQKSP